MNINESRGADVMAVVILISLGPSGLVKKAVVGSKGKRELTICCKRMLLIDPDVKLIPGPMSRTWNSKFAERREESGGCDR